MRTDKIFCICQDTILEGNTVRFPVRFYNDLRKAEKFIRNSYKGDAYYLKTVTLNNYVGKQFFAACKYYDNTPDDNEKVIVPFLFFPSKEKALMYHQSLNDWSVQIHPIEFEEC